jgi:hypothetical protein
MDPQDRPGFSPPPAGALEPAPASHELIAGAPRRSRIGTGIAVAAVAIGALGVAGTAYAASSTSSASPSPSPSNGQHLMPGYGNGPDGAQDGVGGPGMPGARRMGGGFGGGHGPDGMRMGLGAGMAIHGSFVTSKKGGGYQTVDTQQGKVTAVSSSSITVRSEDGFSATYVVNSATGVHALKDGIASVKVDDEVIVVGVESGSTVTAIEILDRTQIGDIHKKFFPQGPKPSASASTSSGTA